jgi:hypothetical protein
MDEIEDCTQSLLKHLPVTSRPAVEDEEQITFDVEVLEILHAAIARVVALQRRRNECSRVYRKLPLDI